MNGKELVLVCREIVETHSAKEVELVKGKINVLDVQTANLVCTVYDKLKKNRENFEKMDATLVIDRCYRALR